MEILDFSSRFIFVALAALFYLWLHWIAIVSIWRVYWRVGRRRLMRLMLKDPELVKMLFDEMKRENERRRNPD